ncbi:hypothetical protein AB0877_02655 [Micromonospora sp. NPDC047644]|uniref:hypothetical protein n=1 Tax=Micromonospora sp. NPDC047644 TaxID=3157203 RepID=UPI00345196A4
MAIVSVVAACGSAADQSAQARKQATATDAPSPAVPATGGPGYSAALSARLVTPESLPPGFTVEIATTMALDAGDRRPDVGAACAPSMIPLLSARRLTGSPSATAAATLSFDAGPDDLWVGTEVLRTYTDDGARRAMADLRTFIGGCPTLVLPDQDGSYRFAVAAGPRLGDDSLHLIQATTSRLDTLEWDVILVRAGTSLVVVQSEGNKPGGVEHLNRVAEAAVHRFQTTGS